MNFQRVALIALVLATPLFAQDSQNWKLRIRAISVSPDASSETILTTGTSVDVDSAVVPELDFSYAFNQRWSAELILATSPHDLSTVNGALAGADAGKVWALPPTVTCQYHFLPAESSVDFYAGIGINYTLFYSYDLSDDLAALGVTDIDFDNSFGLAGDIGADIQIGKKWFLNLDLKYIDMSTDVTLETAAAPLDTLTVDIDPFVFGVGAGFRF